MTNSKAAAVSGADVFESATPELAVKAVHRSGFVEQVAEIVVVAALAGELVAMFGNVIARSLFGTSLLWSLEIAELALVVMTFVGGAIAYPRNEHMALHAFTDRLPQRWHAGIAAFACWQVFAMAIVGGWLAWEMMLSRWDERTPYLGISAIWFAAPMIFGMALLAYFAVNRALLQPRRLAVITFILMVAAVGAVLALSSVLGPQARDYALPAAFVVFVLQLLFGVPIGFVLLMTTLIYLQTSHTIPLSVVPINMQGGISSFVMLSIPFFILAGYVMTEGGLSRRLTDFVISLVGRFRGGMLQVIVVSMYIMSGISGSKVADVAAVGTTMKNVMRRETIRSRRDRGGARDLRGHGRNRAAQHRDAGAGLRDLAVDRQPVRGGIVARRGHRALPDAADLRSARAAGPGC